MLGRSFHPPRLLSPRTTFRSTHVRNFCCSPVVRPSPRSPQQELHRVAAPRRRGAASARSLARASPPRVAGRRARPRRRRCHHLLTFETKKRALKIARSFHSMSGPPSFDSVACACPLLLMVAPPGPPAAPPACFPARAAPWPPFCLVLRACLRRAAIHLRPSPTPPLIFGKQ